MDAQHAHARHLLQVIRKIVQDEGPPILGYVLAAEMIGLNGENYGRHMGQVCSRVDAASFIAGYPMLALQMVRTADGAINPNSFGESWGRWAAEIHAKAASHKWDVPQVDEVIRALDGLPKNGAAAIWADFLKSEGHKPGFIQYNLHRKIPRPPS
jgi:hypothetical protein